MQCSPDVFPRGLEDALAERGRGGEADRVQYTVDTVDVLPQPLR